MSYRGLKRLLVPFYQEQFPSARVVTKLPSDLQAQIPLIQIAAITDLPDRSVPTRFRTVRWALQTFTANGDDDAEEFANQVSTASVVVLKGAALADADVPFVSQASGPSWIPYPDTLVLQYAASFEGRLLVH